MEVPLLEVLLVVICVLQRLFEATAGHLQSQELFLICEKIIVLDPLVFPASATDLKVSGEAVAHEQAGDIEARDGYLFTVPLVFVQDCIKGRNRGRVPKVGCMHVDDDVGRVVCVLEIGC